MARLLKITPPYLSDIEKDRRNSISPDLPEYIMERDYVRAALRKAIDLNVGEDE